MTRADLAPFWGVVAQVVPVLAIALVIEARIIGNRLSKKRSFKDRGSRVRWGLAFAVVGFSLVAAVSYAVGSFLLPQDRQANWVDWAYVALAYAAVAIGALFVITVPIARIVAAAWGDIFLWVANHVPWGAAQKLRKKIRAVEVSYVEIEADARAQVARLLSAAAQAFIVAYTLDAALKHLQKLLATPQLPKAEAVERARAHVPVASADVVQAFENADSAWAAYKSRKEDLPKIRRDAKKVRRLREEHDRDIRRGSTQSLDVIRRQLAEASRT